MSGCQPREPSELRCGLDLLGVTTIRTVRWAADIAYKHGERLKVRSIELQEPIAQELFAMLTLERALLECVTSTGSHEGLRKNDLCPQCFQGQITIEPEIASQMRSRKVRIDRHLAHLTWTPVMASSRRWSTLPVVLVFDALRGFAPTVAAFGDLGARLVTVGQEIEYLRTLQGEDLRAMAAVGEDSGPLLVS